MTSETRNCQNCKKDFTIASEDFEFYKKIDVPPPTWCPQCRMIRRLIWRNERKLFRRPDAFGKEIFSSFPPQVATTIYERDYWWSDSWDPLQYGREYDFSRPFFEQFRELLYTVPWPSRQVSNIINSDFSDEADNLKNTYLAFDCGFIENSAYIVRANTIKDSFDFYDGIRVELGYDSTLIADSFKTFYSLNCVECSDIWLSKDLVGCTNCIGCAGLRKKSYCIFNKQYSKEEYQKEKEKLRLHAFSGLQAAQEKAKEVWLSVPVKYDRSSHLVNSVAEHAMHVKNCHDCWGVTESENLKYCQMAYRKMSDSYDYSVWGDGGSLMYETVTCGDQAFNDHFDFDCWPSCKNLEYSAICRSASDLFGCVGLTKKQYCILNKQYSKEEYEELVPKIKEHMREMPYIDKQGRAYTYGEFFPPEFSPFAYNETQLQDIFPLTQKQAKEKGFLWREQPSKDFAITVKAADLPDDIKSTDEEITKQVIGCAECGKAYRIIPMEIQFLKAMELPLPRLCPECRFQKRNVHINPPVFYDRQCAKCQAAIRTTYAPDRPEIVYCEQCYQAEVV